MKTSREHASRKPLAHLAMCLLLTVLVLSCKPTVPDEYIQPDEMEDILYDYYITQAMAGQGLSYDKNSYNKNVYYYAVLKKHGVTEAEFDSSLVYYYSNADRLYGIYVQLSERIGNEAMSLGASVGDINKYSKLKADGDTADIWRESPSAVLMPVAPYNRLSFELKADSTFKRGDSFLFNFMTDFLYQSGTKDGVAYIAVHYDNDSTAAYSCHVGVSGISQLRVPGDRNHGIKSMKGFIYLNRGDDNSHTLKLMFISRIQLVRFHPEEVSVATVGTDSVRTSRDTMQVRAVPTGAKLADTMPKRPALLKAQPLRAR